MQTLLLDACASVITVILFLFFRKRFYALTFRYSTVYFMLCMVIAASVFEAAAALPGGTLPPVLIRCGYALSFVTLTAAANALPFYVESAADSRYRLSIAQLSAAFPFVIGAVAAVGGIVSDQVFSLDGSGAYLRGAGAVVVLICGLSGLFLAAFFTVGRRKALSRLNVMTLGAVELGCIAACVLQYITGIHVLCFAACVAMTALVMSLQPSAGIAAAGKGLMKKVDFLSFCERQFIRNHDFTITTIILDNYSQIEKMHGIEAMEEIANAVYSFLGEFASDAIGRPGNRKFCLLRIGKEGLSDEETARIVDRFSGEWTVGDHKIYLNTKLLCINCPKDAETAAEIMEIISMADEYDVRDRFVTRIADMSQAELVDSFGEARIVLGADTIREPKQHGYVWHIDEKDVSEFVRRRKVNALIDEAVEKGWLSVSFQPIYSTATGKFHSAEALVGMKTDTLGYIRPDEFIPIAEKNREIAKIDQFVLETVCKFIRDNDISKYGVEFIEVNLSGIECMQADLVSRLLKTIDSYGIRPEQINFEITETELSDLPVGMLDKFNRICEYGSAFSLDDYGVGYSNFQRLIALPLKIVKFDRSLIHGAVYGDDLEKFDFPESREDRERVSRSRVMMENTFKMMKRLNKSIVAEGVETQSELDFCRECGADYIQGYYFAKPMKPDDFLEFIKEKNR